MDEDLLVQPLHGRRWLDAELIAQSASELLVEEQRVGLPATAVQRHHELLVEGLPEAVLRDQRR